MDDNTTNTGKTRKRSKPMTEAERSRNFIAMAKELECDETGQTFEQAFTKAIPQKASEEKIQDGKDSK